jgi:hypothetical protein
MLGSITAGYLWLEETHPDLKAGANQLESHDIAEHTPMITAAGTNADPGIDLRQELYGTFNEVDVHEDKHWLVSAKDLLGHHCTTRSQAQKHLLGKFRCWW